MPSMDQGYSMSAETSSFFSEELRFPTEKNIGFWKPGSVTDKRRPNGVDKMELPQSYNLNNGKTRFSLEHHQARTEMMAGPSSSPQRAVDHGAMISADRLNQPVSSFVIPNHVDANRSNGLLSASLPDMLKKKLTLSFNNVPLSNGSIGTHSNFDEDEPFESMEEIEAQTIGNLLPDDDDLLSSVIDNVGYSFQLASGDDIDDDIFYSGGGIELETDDNINSNNASGLLLGGVANYQHGGINGTLAGEHPFGEHPSRTLFVRNINSNVEDTELKALFEQYGDIRTLYTACKHRGFVMISYYDIRSARNAMRALQNKPLRRRKLDIHYSIPKDNPSEKDINQGTLVVFNLDSTVSNDELLQTLGVYGEIKEIRETPRNRHQKFIEFYDIRAAEAALALNKSDIAGKKIKLEPSWSGGAKRLLQHLSAETEHEELSGCDQNNSINSQFGYFGSVPLGSITSNGLESRSIRSFQSAVRAPISPVVDATFRGISSNVSQTLSSPIRISSVANHCNQTSSGDLSHSLGQMNFGYQGKPSFHPNSLPEYHNGVTNGIPCNSSTMSALGMNIISHSESVDGRHLKNVTSECHKASDFDHNGGAFGVSGNESCPLHGHQYGWNNTNAFQHQVPSSLPWPNSPSFMNNIVGHSHGLSRTPSHMLNTALPLHHHVGSAPAVNPTLWDRRHAYPGDATDSPTFHPGSLGSMGFAGSPQLHQLDLASRNIFSHAGGSILDHSISPSHVGIPSPQQRCQVFHGRNHMLHMPGSFEVSTDRIRSRKNDSSANQPDNKKQYELDIDRIERGEDSRTTLMIKNIPNKYSAKMLLAAIDENHRGTYDFIYLPIDFKNKCNVGYAFINMTAPQHIIPFYQTFNGKKWEKFNSEKVASIAYARIQGKPALIAHFQNSSLMNEDKRCRPIIFHSDGPNVGDQEPFPMGNNIRSRPGRSRTSNSNDEQLQEIPFISPDGEASCDAMESPGSARDLE